MYPRSLAAARIINPEVSNTVQQNQAAAALASQNSESTPAESKLDGVQQRTSDGTIDQTQSAAGALDPGGEGPNSKLTNEQLQKSEKSYEKLKSEHEKKLADYKANPDAHDNKGRLAGAKTPEERQRIIDGRVKELEAQIKKHEGELRKIQEEIRRRGNAQ